MSKKQTFDCLFKHTWVSFIKICQAIKNCQNVDKSRIHANYSLIITIWLCAVSNIIEMVIFVNHDFLHFNLYIPILLSLNPYHIIYIIKNEGFFKSQNHQFFSIEAAFRNAIVNFWLILQWIVYIIPFLVYKLRFFSSFFFAFTKCSPKLHLDMIKLINFNERNTKHVRKSFQESKA